MSSNRIHHEIIGGSDSDNSNHINGLSNELIAHDLAVVVVKNRGIDTPAQAVEEYQSMYKDILHRIS